MSNKIFVKKPKDLNNLTKGYKLVYISKALLEEEKENQARGKKPHPELVGIEIATEAEIKELAPGIWATMQKGKPESVKESNAGKIFVDPNLPTIASKKEDIEKYLIEAGVEIPEGSTKKSLLEIVESLNQPPV